MILEDFQGIAYTKGDLSWFRKRFWGIIIQGIGTIGEVGVTNDT